MPREEFYDNSGVLFRVDEDRRRNSRSPEYNGSATVDGQEYWVSGWVKTSKKTGQRFFSLAFNRKDDRRDRGRDDRDDRRDSKRDDRDDRRDSGRDDRDDRRPPPDDDIPF